MRPSERCLILSTSSGADIADEKPSRRIKQERAEPSGIKTVKTARLDSRGAFRAGYDPRATIFQDDLTSLMGALHPQSPALLAAGAFGGNFLFAAIAADGSCLCVSAAYQTTFRRFHRPRSLGAMTTTTIAVLEILKHDWSRASADAEGEAGGDPG
jgi:hypothetical protein